jgi:catechol 2,3-dioxygenase-like lactoylglutathione lyase family enzyme
MAALGYATVGSNQLEAAKSFYDALLGSVGIAGVFEHPSGGRFYGKDGALILGVLGPYDGKPATIGNGSMFAFRFETREEVIAFHAKALELGGADDGAPGLRAPTFFFSYFRDLDGNKICAYNVG